MLFMFVTLRVFHESSGWLKDEAPRTRGLHSSTCQRKRFWQDRGHLGGVRGLLKAGEGVFTRLVGGVLSVKKGSC